MHAKMKQKEKAISLRKRGKTYSEILKKVPVAKSTLSLWLRDVGLAKKQKQRISKKRREAQIRGGKARYDERVERTQSIFNDAKKDVGRLTKKDLWLMGTMLYWAEGSKEKAHNIGGARLEFMNSDPYMIAVYMRWLREVLNVVNSDIVVSIYIHKNSKHREEDVIRYWAYWAGVSKSQITYIYYKKHNPKTIRKNTNEDYYGALRVVVRRSVYLNRKVAGWIRAINEQLIKK